MLRELLTPDIKGVKSIRTIGAMFEKILFRLGVLEGSSDQGRALLVVLILAEAQPATIYLCRLHRKNQIIVILTVEHRHEALLSSKATVDDLSSEDVRSRNNKRGLTFNLFSFSLQR